MVRSKQETQAGLTRLRQPDIFETRAIANELVNFSIRHYSHSLCKCLISYKELPPCYFQEAAEEIGITKETYRNWRISRCPQADPAIDTKDPRFATEILLKVLLRICAYPEAETYPAAVGRLSIRVNEVINQGFSRNKVAQHLRMSHNSLSEIVNNAAYEQRRPRRCPWFLLNLLENAETEINLTPHRRDETLKIPVDPENNALLPKRQNSASPSTMPPAVTAAHPGTT